MELTLLGGFQLADDAGNPVEVSARKAKALLAWLAMHPDKNHPRDRLALLLWEESDDAQARHSLRQALSGLRKALGTHADTLVTDQENVLFRGDAIRVDAENLEKLLDRERSEEALNQIVALYGGEFLEGFNPRSATYDEWLLMQRSHYREQAMRAMSELLERQLAGNQLEPALRLAIQLLSSDPLQEQTHRALMQIYVRLNRPADALRQYRQCRRILFRELGLAPEAETDRLYREIARARAQKTESPEPVPVPPATASPSDPDAAATAEPQPETRTPATHREEHQQLRPVTVAHLLLGRYHEQLAGQDPEQLHLWLQAVREQVENMAQRYGGQLHHQHGDTMVLLFGLPAAHGNEIEKAVQSAYALRENAGESRNPLSSCGLQIGIANGSVIHGGDAAISGGVFAQAEQLARTGEPGDILCSETAYRSLRLPVEASARENQGWRIDKLGAVAENAERDTPFVGRNRERRQFAGALEACIEDQAGETFLVRGEAGIGKTRLVEEVGHLAHQLGMRCHRALIFDFGMESQAEPIPVLLRQLLDLAEEAAAATVEARVKTCLGAAWNEALHAPATQALFRLPQTHEAQSAANALSEEARRVGSRQLLEHILPWSCREQPRLLVVEDIHWADPHTLALLADLAVTISRCTALMILTSRVEGEPLDPAWRSAMHGAPLTTLDLGPLREEQALALAGNLATGDDEFIARCIERSGGNPFFLEQLLWGSQRRDDAIPDSVQNLVLSRLDILAESDRLAAQTASILGQRFKLNALRHLLDNPAYAPDALLRQRLIRPEGEGYLFSHALLHEGVYASLLPSHRRALHLRAAEWYQESDSALHARHLDLAENEGAAAAYLRAAQAALPVLDFSQALELATRGASIAHEPELVAHLNMLRGDLLIQAGSIGEARRAFEAAMTSATTERDRSRAMIGVATGLTVIDQLDQALELLEQATPLAQNCNDIALLTELHYRRGDILFALARTDDCLAAHQEAERLAQQSHSPLLQIRAFAGLADAYYAQGKMKTAHHYFDRCIELAKSENRLPQEVGNLAMRGLTSFYCGSVSDALADEVEAEQLTAQFGNLRAEMAAQMNQALIYLYTKNIAEAERKARYALELAQKLGATRFYGDNLAAIGEALFRQGRREEGLDYLERAAREAAGAVPTHTCAFVLSVLARETTDEQRRQQAIEEGQRLLDRGCLSHNYLHFYQNLIEVSLNRHDKEGVLHYADQLEKYTAGEPLPWSDFYIERGRLLAETGSGSVTEAQRQRARGLLDRAKEAGIHYGTPELSALL